jgi:hypothetical protein
VVLAAAAARIARQAQGEQAHRDKEIMAAETTHRLLHLILLAGVVAQAQRAMSQPTQAQQALVVLVLPPQLPGLP